MKYYLFLVFFVVFNQSFAQKPSNHIIIGNEYQLKSELLGENITIQISTPKNYNNSEGRYPVLYVLDGQWFFPHALSIRSDYTQRNGSMLTPEFVVVGITIDNSKRWEWAMEKTSLFLNFMEKELLPFVDKNYRTTEDRLLFGWETTGGLVIKTLSLKSELFDAYLAASPAPLYGSYFKNLENEYLAFQKFLKNSKELNMFLFIGEGESDYPVLYGTKAIESLLKVNAPEGLKWHHKIMNESTHQMCAYKTLQEGLKEYYKYHHFLTFNNKTEFERLGGLKYIETFYEKRRTQLEIENDDEFKHATRRNLTFVAISENDYKWFDSLFETFKKDNLLEKSFPPHLNDYAQFYLKHEKPNKALEIISYTINKYPDNAQSFNSLGNINVALNKMKEAKKNYQLAVEIGSKNGDWRISEYKNNLDKSTNKK